MIDIVSRAVTRVTILNRSDEGLLTLAFLGEYQAAINGIDDDCVVNMDETGLAYDTPPKRAFAEKGAKTICIATRGLDKNNVTVALAVTLSGLALKPFIIYRGITSLYLISGKVSGRIQRELRSGIYPQNMAFAVNESAWMDTDKMLQWISEVWLLLIFRFWSHTSMEDVECLFLTMLQHT
jgi:hypothetical protein